VDTILSSTTRLVANRGAWDDPWKRRKIEDLALLLQGALAARRKVGLKMNLHRDALDTVRGPPAARPEGPTSSAKLYCMCERGDGVGCCEANGALPCSLHTACMQLPCARSTRGAPGTPGSRGCSRGCSRKVCDAGAGLHGMYT